MTTRILTFLAGLALISACSSDPSNEETDAADDTSTDVSRDNETDSGPPSWSICAANSDCVLADNSCCGVCSQPELSDVDAINQNEVSDHYADVCDEPDPQCPACALMPNPWLGATCEVELCAAFDLRETELVTCTADDDCALRVTDCCECGGDTNREALIALTTDAVASYVGLVCDPETTCPACEPSYPDTVEAFCSAAGRCDIREASE